jgi:hypothetical protein
MQKIAECQQSSIGFINFCGSEAGGHRRLRRDVVSCNKCLQFVMVVRQPFVGFCSGLEIIGLNPAL